MLCEILEAFNWVFSLFVFKKESKINKPLL